MKQPRDLHGDNWIVSPCVMYVLGNGVMLRIVALRWQMTYRWGNHVESFERNIPFGLSFFAVLALVDVALPLLLAFELPSAWRVSPSVGRGRIAGIVLAMLTIGAIQNAGELVHQVVERGPLLRR